MKTIHLKGFLENFDIREKLDSEYDLDVSFDFEEESEDYMDNCFIRMYFSDNECSLEEAIGGWVETVFGKLEMRGQEYGYSEYTITGFNINEANIGGHDLNKIIKEKGKTYKYVHILIDQV